MIRAASEQLAEEQTNQFWQEGVLRNLPLFGGIYSWILPAGTSPVKGRSFKLSSGKHPYRPPIKDLGRIFKG